MLRSYFMDFELFKSNTCHAVKICILHAFKTLDFSLIYKNPGLAKSLWYNELALLFVYALKSGIVE